MLDLRWWVVGAIETLWDCLGKQKVDEEEEDEDRKLEEYIDLCWEQDGPTRLDPRPVMLLFMYIGFPLFDITGLNNCFHRKFTDALQDVWLIKNMIKD